MSGKVVALSFPGRSANPEDRELDRKQRKEGQKELEDKVNGLMEKRSVKNQFAKVHVKDLSYANDKLCFVGCGAYSNQAGFDYLMYEKCFTSNLVVHVRDVFDLHEQRPFLTSTFLFASSDVVILNKAILDPLKRRLVNEYVLTADGEYQLRRHDIEFSQYVHSLGLRIIPTDKTGQEFIDLSTSPSLPAQQSTNHVLMVAPTAFLKNLQAAEDNQLMFDSTLSEEMNNLDIQRQALQEFSELHKLLNDVGKVQVHLFTHETYHDTPDAVFPNNWFSTHSDFECGESTLVLYPMKLPNRRKERRPEFISRLENFHRYTHVLDLTRQEKAHQPSFLEGTGSLVLDRVNKIAYVSISERTDLNLARKWGNILQYQIIPFRATDAKGRPYSHTDVLLTIGTSFAIICSQAIEKVEERNQVLESLKSTGHTIIDITREQVSNFCGNVLELENWKGFPVLAMSNRAYNSFTPKQRETLLEHVQNILHAEFSTIEKFGGGSVRCAIAELF